ncbi:hypothetical protein [Humisphaera borealis]|uniref:Transporter n=1 Tax=Humisphaera borealis TaxID=2807512 RepID=A0A7M2WUT9_9BACT|nr:hypothetical protein [Humisphaera borealis]QOV88952.1 hypothetical protein IPV69_22425 [Humisphaera borealis]
MKRRLLKLTALAGLFLSAAATNAQAQFVLFPSSEKAPEVKPENTFVHPVTSPYFHEDAFVTTDARAWFLYHDFPSGGVIDGGNAKVYALQVRVALTNQLQLVAYKDGYTDFDAGLLQDDGWNDLAAGLKWTPIQNHEKQFYLSVGAGYEFPVGDPGVLQNDGEVRVWAAVNKGFGPLHLGGTVNFFYPTSRGDEPLGYSETMSWHFHADYYVCQWFSPVVEVNGYHVLNKHNEAVPFSGIDVTNLGGGDDVISLGLGAELRPMEKLGLRAAWETPLTSGDDLFGWRVTVSAVISF